MLAWLRGWTSSHSDAGYEPLPALSFYTSAKKSRCRTRVKVLLCCIPVVVVGTTLLVYALAFYPNTWRSRLISLVYTPDPRPPLYPEFREAESRLPQHNVTDPFANGQKYLFASSHVYCEYLCRAT